MKRTGLKLRTRIGLYFLGLGVTWTVFVVLLLGDLLSDTSRQLLRERGAHLARLLALECAPLVHYEDASSISKVLAEHVSPPSDVRYIVVLNGTGDVMWSTFHAGVPSALLAVPHTTEAGPGVLVQLVRMRDELLYDYEEDCRKRGVDTGGWKEFRAWMDRVGGAKEIANGLADLDVFPAYEDDPDFYVDYGETGPYVKEIGESECAT